MTVDQLFWPKSRVLGDQLCSPNYLRSFGLVLDRLHSNAIRNTDATRTASIRDSVLVCPTTTSRWARQHANSFSQHADFQNSPNFSKLTVCVLPVPVCVLPRHRRRPDRVPTVRPTRATDGFVEGVGVSPAVTGGLHLPVFGSGRVDERHGHGWVPQPVGQLGQHLTGVGFGQFGDVAVDGGRP